MLNIIRGIIIVGITENYEEKIMDKLFIDTNVYEAKGFNFDEKNILIKVLTNNIKNRKYEYCNLSVIDNEIKAHINKKGTESKRILHKKYKWIENHIEENIIYENCYKDLIDYENFKNVTSATNCDVSLINPEKVFKKYFSMELPFEDNKNKRKEFPDAFIAEYLNDLINNSLDYKIHFISNDNGLKQALDKKINKYTTIEEFLTTINGMDPDNYSNVIQIIEENLSMISSEILSRLDVKCTFIEEEEINIDAVILNNNFDVEILDEDENKIYVNCIFSEISLIGSFICLDHENSHWPNDEEYYVYTQYLKADKIDIENFEMSLTIDKNNGEYELGFDNIYTVEINYEKMKEFACDSFSPLDDYDGEDSWTQDGYMR